MCGICGMTGEFVLESTLDAVIQRMLDTLYTRGPDDSGIYQQPGITLAMRRLAVIDIAGGHQPLQDINSGVTLVFNGEIYNYQDLRIQLEKNKQHFNTQSDTEIILRGYLAKGMDFIAQLNGMFAIAIWDPRIKQLLLARDHLGQKPLYYYHSKRGLVFGSDLRTLLAHPNVPRALDHQSLASYLQLRHVPGPDTIIKDILQLPPGYCLILNEKNQLSYTCYWEPYFQPDSSMSITSAKEEFTALWPEVIKRHLQSEVEIGAFLSGGIDSSLIVSEAIKHNPGLKTFSVAFSDHGFDETPYAKQVAEYLDCEHEVFHFDEPFTQLLKAWSQAYDQPFSDPAVFPSLMMTKFAKSKVTVALSGDAGDELFAGYQRYQSTLFGRKLAWMPPALRQTGTKLIFLAAKQLSTSSPSNRQLVAIARRLSLIEKQVDSEYCKQFHIMDNAALMEIGSILPRIQIPPSLEEPLLSWMLKYDLEHWLPDQMLVKVDRASMASSLEVRLPFLDREIVEFALRIPAKLQIDNGELKHVLRSLAREKLSTQISKRPKHGFAVPVDQILRDNARIVSEIFSSELHKHSDYLHTKPILGWWREHQELTINHGEPLLTILLFLIWYRDTFSS